MDEFAIEVSCTCDRRETMIIGGIIPDDWYDINYPEPIFEHDDVPHDIAMAIEEDDICPHCGGSIQVYKSENGDGTYTVTISCS